MNLYNNTHPYYCGIDLGADLKAHVANTTSQYNLPPNKVNLKNEVFDFVN